MKKKDKRKGKPKAKRKGSRKSKSGTPFEKRAQAAIQHLHKELEVKHNEKLESKYLKQRQFDLTATKGEGASAVLARTYEAKDHGSPVPYEKVEAFVTKVSELKNPPTEGAGIISAAGFQKGPLDRAKILRQQGGRMKTRFESIFS